MFGWSKRTVSPTTCSANPGKGVKAQVAFANGGRSWTEEVDILSCMAEVLKRGGYACALEKSWIECDGGFVLQPRFMTLHPLEKGGVQTVTTIEVSHPTGIPASVFEYQHSTGDTTHEAIAKGFESWLHLDLPVFLDTIQPQPKHCAAIQFDLPEKATSPARKRRVVLGPVSHFAARPAEGPPDEHPFCPCCLFTHADEVMQQKVSDDNFYGIRLFAMRGQDGSVAADCRVNGEDWETGKSALAKYVNSWPDRGVEFRKQYIVIQNQPPQN